MKTTYKLIVLLASLFALGSCTQKWLDIPQQGVQNEAASYVSDSDCDAATAAIYREWRHTWSGKGDDLENG